MKNKRGDLEECKERGSQILRLKFCRDIKEKHHMEKMVGDYSLAERVLGDSLYY